ncbi:tyrosine-type recombinase/integrase [Kitasatospora phosalacinea]|nr:site-specific integrase [Kitasatospora phosalacinea]
MATVLRKVDAEAKRTEIESSLGLGTYRDPRAGRIKMEEIAESWISSKVDLRGSSRDRYRGILDLHVIPRWGTTAVADVQHDDIVTWLGKIMSDSVEAGSPLSAATIRKIWVVIKGVLGFAVRSKKIAYNPAIDVPLPRYTPSEHVYLTDVQIEALAEACGQFRTLILFLAYTGVRWGEATAIQIKNVNLKTRRVRISQAWGSDKGKPHLEDSPKNHERRSVPIPAFLAKELEIFIGSKGAENFLFTAPRGGILLNPNFTRRYFKAALVTAGLDKMGVTPHKLRHTAASLAIASGADVKVVQTMLGHKTATLTLDTYGHLWPDRLDEVSDRLDAQRTKALAKARQKAEKAARKARQLAEQLAALEAGGHAAA